MNMKHLIAAVIAVSSAASAYAVQFAEVPTQDAFANTVSSKTRAAVLAEVVQAKANGTYVNSEAGVQASANAPVSTRTRADVAAELRKAKADGTFVDSEVNAGLSQKLVKYSRQGT